MDEKKFEKLMDGKYDVAVVGTTLKTSANGNDYIWVNCKVLNGANIGRFGGVQYYCNEKSLPYTVEKLQKLGVNVGDGSKDSVMFSSDQLIGQEFQLKLQTKDNGYQEGFLNPKFGTAGAVKRVVDKRPNVSATVNFAAPKEDIPF